MVRYKLTFTDENTGTTYLLGDNMPDYDSAVFAVLEYVASGAAKAGESGDTAAEARLINAGISMAIEFAGMAGLDCASCYGFTITREGK